MSDHEQETARRRTFAIISHPDAGKTTLTEKLLLFGGAIREAGSVKSRKTTRHATSDWMALERERGISVTSSVMQFPYAGRIVNLLDTPGHADFSEDTYRVLTAVDSALMVIDCAKGVEERTIKLMDVCRLRDTPIMTFINKLDREGRDPLELLDEVESILKIECTPITWPIGMGSRLQGIYHFLTNEVHLYESGRNFTRQDSTRFASLDDAGLVERIGADVVAELREELELLQGASHAFDVQAYLAGRQTPVFFGSAVSSFGVEPLLDFFVEHAPAPHEQMTRTRTVAATETDLTGFVFKIQANMDPKHRDRVGFMRVCSGSYKPGDTLFHVRSGRNARVSDALTFMASDRVSVTEAYPGDIVGLKNYGTIAVGDTFTQGESLQFTGLPSFAPELFRRPQLRDPLRAKALQKGIDQLCEEGAAQLFRPLASNDLVLGAIGVLQFDVVAYRLRDEYNVAAQFEAVNVFTARWVSSDDPEKFAEFCKREVRYLAVDAAGSMTYLAPSMANLQVTQDRWPAIRFAATRDIG